MTLEMRKIRHNPEETYADIALIGRNIINHAAVQIEMALSIWMNSGD
jgi:hypothetical protein